MPGGCSRDGAVQDQIDASVEEGVERVRQGFRLLRNALQSDLDIPGYGLHELTGKRKGIWAISVSGNWRLTFEFSDGNVYLLDYEDYH